MGKVTKKARKCDKCGAVVEEKDLYEVVEKQGLLGRLLDEEPESNYFCKDCLK